MARAGKDRLDDRRVGFTVEGRVEDDGIGWGDGDGDVVEEAGSGVQRVLVDG